MPKTSKIRKIRVSEGIYWVEAPEAGLYVQCGCPADSVKHLMKRGLIVPVEEDGVSYEDGPNAILLSDVMLQGGDFSNLAEFPVLQMLYRQGMILPGHPNNTGAKPLLMGLADQVSAQLHYIHRGNYGLISEEEIAETGFDVIPARHLMRLKLKFAFGKILDPRELIDTLFVGARAVEIRNGVFIKRVGLNVYEFEYQGEKVAVDLNLAPEESYASPYPLGFHQVQRHYFAVVHSGDGDGWDINRPCMSSVLVFQGKIHLIDAGPNILFNLMALGVGVNEIEGIFLTHSHDDHFAGLASLMRSDHRIKCYATPLVRASVAKKLSALLSIEEDSLDHYFDSRDIQFNVWNDIGGLEALPIFSPHPVETSCLFFRAQGGEGYKTYAHLADIASLKVLEGMITQSDAEPGVSRDLFEKVKIDYLMPADLKKIDIGGGLIHGEAEDFREDRSKKIILSHTSNKLTVKQKEIGSSAAFGSMDVLMEGRYDHVILKAQGFIKSYFPSIPDEQSNILLNNPVMTFKPEAILARKGERPPFIYLVLTGIVERIHGETGARRLLSAGALIGELSGLLGHPASETFLAVSYVQALRIKCELYLEFVQRNNLFDEISQLQINRAFLQATSLFGESISYPIQNRIAKEMTLMRHDKGAELVKNQTSIFIMKSGAVERFIGEDVLETMTQGDYFGEEFAVFGTPSVYGLRATEPTEIFAIPGAVVKDIPLVRWKLFEAFERRMRAITALDAQGDLLFQWRDEYGVNIQEMDRQHHKLFDMANNLLRLMKSEKNRDDLEDALTYLLEFTKAHFESEENLMKLYGFPGLKTQKAKHARLMKKADEIKTLLSSGDAETNEEFIVFLKDWVVGHILAEDKKYGSFLNKKGVY